MVRPPMAAANNTNLHHIDLRICLVKIMDPEPKGFRVSPRRKMA